MSSSDIDVVPPLHRQHLGYGDCLEKREDIRNCYVLYCAPELCKATSYADSRQPFLLTS